MFKAQAAALRAERDRFIAFSFATADLLLEVDGDGTILFGSGAARHLTGRQAEALVGMRLDSLLHPDDRRFVARLLRQMLPGRRMERTWIKLIDPAGAVRVVQLSGYRLNPTDSCRYLSLFVSDDNAASAAALGRRDRTTGLLIAADFQARAVDRLRMATQQGAEARLTLVELAGLPRTMARLGDQRGDALAGDIGAALRARSLGQDSAGTLDQGRFSVLHAANLAAEDICRDVEEVGRQHAVDVNDLGIVSRTIDFPAGSLSEDDIANALAYAVTRFAAAGAAGFGAATAEDSLKELVTDTLARISSLRSTVSDDRFGIVFQPIVRLESRAIQHYEVLTRFVDGESPFEAIRFAEGVDIVHEIDLAVLRRAVDRLLTYPEGTRVPSLAVNVSARSLQNSVFLTAARAILAENPGLRSNVILEITESSALSDLEAAAAIVAQVRADGHAVCLDDFGAGASSFPYLQALQVDYVKIDGAYVKRVLGEDRDRHILEGMIWLCRRLRVRTVAEMVETEAQAETLQSIGVELGQGWLYGKPSPDLPPPQLLRTGEAAARDAGTARNMRRRGTSETWS